jgi:predicted HTH transcriptional regulator
LSFFDLPPAAIDRSALDAFLAERLAESLNLDYKQELSDGVFETIAAMANTYGGIILVGVAEDPDHPTRPLLPPVGVDVDVRERLINQSYTRLQPPFAPDVVPVPIEGGKVVLVIRVDSGRADRPIVLTRATATGS